MQSVINSVHPKSKMGVMLASKKGSNTDSSDTKTLKKLLSFLIFISKTDNNKTKCNLSEKMDKKRKPVTNYHLQLNAMINKIYKYIMHGMCS